MSDQYDAVHTAAADLSYEARQTRDLLTPEDGQPTRENLLKLHLLDQVISDAEHAYALIRQLRLMETGNGV